MPGRTNEPIRPNLLDLDVRVGVRIRNGIGWGRPMSAGRQHRGCDACPEMWSDRWVDLIVPDDAWAAISPCSDDGESGGYLCAGCVAERLLHAGLHDVPVVAYGRPFWTGTAR